MNKVQKALTQPSSIATVVALALRQLGQIRFWNAKALSLVNFTMNFILRKSDVICVTFAPCS